MARMSSSRRSPGAESTHDAPTAALEAERELGHGLHRRGVVPVVEDDLEGQLVEDVGAPGHLEVRRVERAQALADVLDLHAHRVGHDGREHGVLHVVHRLALERRRDEVRPEERQVRALVVERDHVAVDALLEHGREAAGAEVLAHEVVARVHGHVGDARRLRVVGHAQAVQVVGVEHGAVARDLDDDALHLGELLERLDALRGRGDPR